MLSKILSGAVVGLDAVPVTVEVDIAVKGLPNFTIVGLPDKAVEESKERVRSAIKNSGAEFPGKRITVNLAPADLPKAGPSYDLPIALGILAASGQIVLPESDSIYIGELSLDGSLRHTNGILPIAVLAQSFKQPKFFVPSIDALEAAVIAGLTVYPVPTLLSLYHHLTGNELIVPCDPIEFTDIDLTTVFDFDMADITGQEQVKRALEIAASGSHNISMQGPPGAGKTMLARSLPSILPNMTEVEAIEVTKIYSITGNLPSGQSLMKHRPFRSPHHTTSRIGLIGGGAHPLPGEISLAHRGVLFLDEFPEFPRHVLEALRQPLEDGVVHISRAAGTVSYPAKFTLVAAANPCPCGNYGSPGKRCICMPGAILRYQQRVSGPIIDRIDLHVNVPAVAVEKLSITSKVLPDNSATIRKRVQSARNIQRQRFRETNLVANSDMSSKAVKEFCHLSTEASQLLSRAINQFGLSARSYYRIIKVSQTIADLGNSKSIEIPHIAEALQYRPKE